MRDIRPDDLETVADMVQTGIHTLRDDPTYRHAELDKWQYVPEDKVDWRPRYNYLPAYAVYDKSTMERMLIQKGAISNKERLKVAWYFYLFNISGEGVLSEPHVLTPADQLAWYAHEVPESSRKADESRETNKYPAVDDAPSSENVLPEMMAKSIAYEFNLLSP